MICVVVAVLCALCALAVGAATARKRSIKNVLPGFETGAPTATARFKTTAQDAELRAHDGTRATTLVHIVAKSVPSPSVAAAAPPPLLALYSNLARAFAEARRSGVPINNRQPSAPFEKLDSCVRSLIAAYLRAAHTDWRRYVDFNPHHYLRHLVEECEDFELMLICWMPGQGSHVHNHADSHCWLTVMEGSVAELQYKAAPEQGSGEESAQPPCLPGVLGATRPCPTLHHTSTAVIARGGTAYINDRIALHSVACPASCPGQGAVTLHLYAPPIRRVELYQADQDRVVQRVPGFYTRRGQKSAVN